MLNQTKIGRYEVIAPLGQGAMGTVYKAVDPLIERTVAIKTISLNLSNEERAEFEERFYREAKSAGRLNHPNIVTIYDVGETGDIAYIAMEYLEGESLREMLDSGVVLPVEMIGKIAARIASALNYAHENFVVHRDIKPANIMITPNRNVKIMDFGIAQIPTGSRTQLGTVLGSPKYMAPEQVAGQATDGKTDIFALGVVLYEMLTGTTPFNGDNLSAIMYKILNEDPTPPSVINPRVPPIFDRIVSRALAKRPEDRYQTAREFAQDLRNQDAVPLHAASQPTASNRSATTRQARSLPPEEHDTTLFLPPHQARKVFAAASVDRRAGIKGKIALALQAALLSRKALFFAVPVLVITAFAIYLQSPQPLRRAAPAQVAPVSGMPRVPVPQPAVVAANAPVVFPAAPAKPVARVVPAAKTTPAPAALAQEKATLSLAISPWGEVFIDGKSMGVSPPLNTLQLEPGRHTVEIRNQAFAGYRDTVNVMPGQSLKIRHKFR
ncbi:MAG: protein kinase [Thiobacillus sp.]|nr:protein kinase [Thiobacillus sp.]